jgi:hypothetical protein
MVQHGKIAGKMNEWYGPFKIESLSNIVLDDDFVFPQRIGGVFQNL